MTNLLDRARWALHARRERAAEARREAATRDRHQQLADADGGERGDRPDGAIPHGQRVHHVQFGDGRYVEDDIRADGQESWSGWGCFPAAGDHYDFDLPDDEQDPQRYQLHGAMHHDLLVVTDDDADEEIDQP